MLTPNKKMKPLEIVDLKCPETIIKNTHKCISSEKPIEHIEVVHEESQNPLPSQEESGMSVHASFMTV